ncbi:Rho guanine nucleotide exchange factor 16 [Cichlidogyrus casuarinus]|uniref:Rho guanine nucleotide exchange factor 16 n=1 Tax=Cichlidogyrus casuarinus TaxID=1844966 RepID=A0ABD2PZX6_9PLAT
MSDLDCPQMICVKPYSATQPDELDLREGDVLNVIVRISDGWCKGILQDGKCGWVLTSSCEDVEDPTARRMNMKNFNLTEQAKLAYNDCIEKERKGLFSKIRP